MDIIIASELINVLQAFLFYHPSVIERFSTLSHFLKTSIKFYEEIVSLNLKILHNVYNFKNWQAMLTGWLIIAWSIDEITLLPGCNSFLPVWNSTTTNVPNAFRLKDWKPQCVIITQVIILLFTGLHWPLNINSLLSRTLQRSTSP